MPQVDMKAFGGKPYPFMLVAIDALTKKVAAEPLKDRLASTTAAGMKKVFQALGVPANVYSDDGSEFKREFKELMDFWDIEKQVTRGHAYFAEHTIRSIKEAMLRRIAAGAGRREWRQMLADILSQINGRKHATTQVAPNLAYSDPEMAEIALRNIERRAKHKVTRPEIKVGDIPKTLFPNSGLEVQSRQRRLQTPTSLLMLSVPLRLYSRQLRLPL